MREILITILILGCFSTFASAERGLFEFFDSYGRCWRCFPGSACVRCPGIINLVPSGPPNEWDRECLLPDEATCQNYPGAKFPSTDIRFYYICSDDGLVIAPCLCDKVFQFSSQSCVYADELRNVSCHLQSYQCTELWICGTPTPAPYDCPGATPPIVDSTTTPLIPTAPTDSTTTPSVPTAPTDPNDPTVPTAPTESTTKPPIWIPTAPNETPTIQPPTTTPPIWVPTAPNETPTIQPPTTTPPIWVPTAPTETTTSNGITDPNTIPTRTTEMGLPEGWNPPYFTEPPTGSTTIGSVPTAPTDTPPTGSTNPPIWVPTVPNESTTTANGITDPNTPPTGPTRTTEIGGPGVTDPGKNTTNPANTTPAPCVCVVWWPCWCNPCWNMPCHSCNGCYGMMG